jgi:hypothetical protein
MIINPRKYSDLDLALMTLLGYFGTGSSRRKNLGKRYAKVQILVNQISRGTMPEPEGMRLNRLREVLEEYRPTEEEFNAFTEEIIEKVKED